MRRSFTLSVARLVSAQALGLALAGAAAAQSPNAVITIPLTSGPAPLTVHAHALNSSLGVGTQNTARYQWTFGDSTGAFNALEGWNAAHVYDAPGMYTLTLRVTAQNGQQSTATKQIVVGPANRTVIYVSPSGSDSNSGLSPATPIRTVARAAQLLGNNKEILFRRNASYDVNATVNIPDQNVLIGAYGSGSVPVLYFTVNSQYAGILSLDDSSRDVTIENIKFDSPFPPGNLIVRGIHPHGSNITVRNCQFGNVSYAMNTGGGAVSRLLALNNSTGVIGAYFIWAEGSDHVYTGNTVGGSVAEHNIRLGGATRVLISHNDLTNTYKSTIWCMLGSHAYIAHNILRSGRVIVGPNWAAGSPSERFGWTVIESNDMRQEGFIFYSGAEYLMARNNVISHGGEAFSIWGYYAPMDRTCRYITLANNTAINDSTLWGRFARVGNGAENVTVRNNLYCAPWLNAQNGSNNINCEASSLTTQNFRDNLWATPATGTNPHQVSSSQVSVAQWAAFNQTQNEMYRAFNIADLNGNYRPMFDASVGSPVPGVYTDFNGSLRPAVSVWSVGAVELNVPGGSSIPFPADLNGDGVVDLDDLLIMLQVWGPCPPFGGCQADLSGNGSVGLDDVLMLLSSWG